MDVLVEADRLRKTFGPITAVDDISLSVRKGEVLGFLGPNGAGKSTTMKMLTGFLEADSGTASICGHDVSRAPQAAKACVGYLPEGAPAYGDMTPKAFLRFISDIRGLGIDRRETSIASAIARTGLEGVLDQRIDTLSKGFKRRVGLAQAILHDPPVLIMDEPTDGLDPNQKHLVRTLITEMAKDKAIIVSTHILEEVEAVCTRAVVIDRGRIVADGTAEDLQGRLPYHKSVVVRVASGDAERAVSALTELPAAEKVERVGGDSRSLGLRVIPKATSRATLAADVAAALSAKSIAVNELYVERGKLDDVFRRITSQEGRAAHA